MAKRLRAWVADPAYESRHLAAMLREHEEREGEVTRRALGKAAA